jgi:hypothetical protein
VLRVVLGSLIFLCLRASVAHAQGDPRRTPVGSYSSAQRSDFRPGLVATFTDANHRVSFVTASPNFYLNAGESPHPVLSPQFEAEWSGYLSILQAAAYSFESGSAEISIDGRQVRGPIQLTPGRYPIRISYERTSDVAQLRLQWEADEFLLEPIPLSRLSHQVSARPERSCRAGPASV